MILNLLVPQKGRISGDGTCGSRVVACLPPSSVPGVAPHLFLVPAARQVTDADEQADTLNHICMIQARTGDFAGARKTADSIDRPRYKSYAYGHIARAMARADAETELLQCCASRAWMRFRSMSARACFE